MVSKKMAKRNRTKANIKVENLMKPKFLKRKFTINKSRNWNFNASMYTKDR